MSEEGRPGDHADRAPVAFSWCDQDAVVQEDLREAYAREVLWDGHVLGVHVLLVDRLSNQDERGADAHRDDQGGLRRATS